MRRILVVMTMAVVMVAMMLAMAMPAFAGNAKGQNNTNPGYTEDSVGDSHNDVCGWNCNPDRAFGTRGEGPKEHGQGTGNN